MADTMIQSVARGAWGYEVGEGVSKETHFIKYGLNTLPEAHMKAVRANPGYAAMCKKEKFKELKPAELRKKTKVDAKAEATAKELEDFKKDFAAEKKKLLTDHATAIKNQKQGFETRIQEALELKVAAEKQVKELEAEKINLVGRIEQQNQEIAQLKKPKAE